MGNIVRLPTHHDHDDEAFAMVVEALCGQVVRACRARTRMTPEAFAAAINARSSRRPGLIGQGVRSAESGVHPLPMDLVAVALDVAGVDSVKVLKAVLKAIQTA